MPHHRILAGIAAIAAAASAACAPSGESARSLDESLRSTRLSVDTSTAGLDVRQFAQLRGGPDRLEENVRFGVLLRGGDFVFAGWHSERPLYIANLGSGAIRPLLGVGGGPREVMAISAIHRGTEDSVFVFDAMNRRVNVLSPRGEWVSSFRAEIAALAPDLVRTGSGDFVFAGWIAAADRLGHPLHMVGRDGQLGPSFGASASTGPSVTHDDRFAMQRRVVLEPGGTLLSVAVGSYVIERWTASGDLLGRWDVAPDWFTPKNTFIATSHEEPPPPRVAAIQVDRRGRVWTLVYRPDEDWQRGVAPPRQAPSAFELLAHEDYVDTQIEVFDPQTFERIASLRVDDPLGEFVAAGIAMTAEVTDSEGYPLVRFWRVSLPERR